MTAPTVTQPIVVIADLGPWDYCDASAAPKKITDEIFAGTGSLPSESSVEQASFRYTKGGLLLDLCPHHNRKHELALIADGWTLHSTVARNVAPSISANAE